MLNKKMSISMLVVMMGACVFLDHTVFAATTYYVRTDGGTPIQCTGTVNAAYSGTGTGQPCALNHPAWALGVEGTPKGLLVGGDTLIIDDTNHTDGSQAQYMIGYGMPNSNSPNCSLHWSYDCVMSPVPSGPDALHPTKIVGISYNSGCSKKPQLWGTDAVNQIFNLTKDSNVDMECMELTDHSNCGFRVGNPVCAENWNTATLSGPYGKNGIYAQGGSNFSFIHMDVHGFANRGFLMGGINGVTFSYVNMDGNYQSNWDSDVGETNNVSYNSGTIVLDHVKNRFAGCSEAYPRSASFNTADYSNCTDQNDAGYGDGYGGYNTGGNWIITNTEFSHNTQDGLDLLYHDATGSITIQRSLFEGNDGNQLKVSSSNIDIENSVFVANCTYLAASHKVFNASSWASCRAGGDAIVWSVAQGGTYKLLNSSVYAGGNSNVIIANRLNTCDGTETYLFRNNIYQGNGNSSLYLTQLGGLCDKPSLITDYSIVNNVSGNYCPSGMHNKCSTDPKWVQPINLTADSNLPNVYLQSDSPALGVGSIILGLSALDYNGVNRGAYWNMGAIQNVSTTDPVVTPVVTTPTMPVTPVTTPVVNTPITPVVTAPVTTTPVKIVLPPNTISLSPTVKFIPATTPVKTTSTWGTVVTSSTTSPMTIKFINGKVTFIKK